MSDTERKIRPPDHDVTGWKNAYVLYIILTTVLFGGLLLLAYLAWTNGWIPNRGTMR